MGLLQRFFGRKDETRLLINGQGPQQFLPTTIGTFAGGGKSDAGVNVDEQTALTASSVFACVNVIANAVASLPVHVMGKDDATAQKNHPLYALLHDQPNEYMTAATFRECFMVNLLLWGHATAYIERDTMGVPIALYPLRSAVTRPVRFMGGDLKYRTIVGNSIFYLTPDQVYHVVGLTFDGVSPISPIEQARQTVGLSLALERFAAKFFSNGGNVGGILTLPPGMKEDAILNFVASWKKNYGGPENSFKVAALPENYKFTPTTTEPEKAQALQARVNQVLEIARIFRVPPHKIGELSKATFSNIEHQSIEFQQDTVAPWVNKLEQEGNRKLLLEREKPTLEIKFDMDAMLRADTVARYSAYMQGRQGGWLSVNDIRRKEGLPPIPGGDIYLTPLNMVGVGAPSPAPAKPDAAASRALVEDAARRCLTKESKALTRAAKKYQGKPAELRAWAETFYAAHAPLVVRVLSAPIKAAGIKAAPEDYAKTHVAESIRAITAGIDAGADVLDIADEWAEIRPAEIADHLLSTGG